MPPKGKRGGRRSKDDLDTEYWVNGEGLVKVKEWLEQGCTDQCIANNIGVDRKTIHTWKKRHEAFGTIFKKERGNGVVELENATYRSAKGYYYDEEVIDVKGNKHVIKKWAQPSVAAQMFMLKNWDREKYRDKWDVEVTGNLPVILKGEDELPD